ncbi:ABC transporter substrate-binding protein [Bradyrhizobium sp. dw_78]|uniref:ABC transporter substrate-binding protein n=1 Tax=Bradyrhizobium sp. dw_78 TaxID=2719793 RepID=UPI001BD52E06
MNIFGKSAAVAAMILVASTAAKADDRVKFVLDWFPAGYIGFAHVGIKEGFFKQEGLDVTIDIGRGGSDAVARVAAGTDDFGAASLSSVMNAAANAPVPAKAVLAIYSKSPDAIVARVGTGIDSIKDLDKKTLATATFSGSNQVWPVMAKNNGLDPDNVKFLKVDNNALGPMLAASKVDAVISWVTSVPLYSKLAAESGVKLKAIPWSEFGLSGYNWSLLASEKIIKERPEVAKKFVSAFKKSVEFALAHPEQAGKDVHELAPDTDAETNTIEIEAMKPLVDNEISKRTGFGAFDPKLVADTWKWVALSQGYPENKIDPESVIDRSLLK